MNARRRTKVLPLPTPATKAAHINHTLLDEARKDAYVLLLALDGILHGAGDYMHAEKEVESTAPSGLAAALSAKLATIGRQADGAEP
jgi:hypothetical protein